MKTAVLALAAAFTLSACNQYTFNREAGDMDTGNFGNATMQNTLIASGQMLPPMGHDKYDPARQGTLLSGQYAAVIMTEYESSALRPHPGNTVIETQTNPSGN